MQIEGCAKAFSANTLFVGSGSCWTEWEKKKEDFHKIIGQYGVVPVAHKRNGRRILPLQRKNDVASQEKEHEGGLKTFGDDQVRLLSVIQCRGIFPWQISRQERYEEHIVSEPDGSSKSDTPFLKAKRNNAIDGYDGRTDDEQIISKWQANDGRHSIIIRKSWRRRKKWSEIKKGYMPFYNKWFGRCFEWTE